MTLSDAKTLVAAWVDDINLGYFTASQVTTFLNNGAKEVQKLLLQAGNNRYLTCVETTTVLNQPDYVLPIDFRELHRLEIIQNGTFPNESKYMVEPMTLNQQDIFMENRTGLPAAYFLKKNKIVFWPCPDGAYRLRMYYSYLVTNVVNDTDVFDVPDEYTEFICVLAALDCVMKDGRDASVFLEKKKYYENMLRNDAQDRQVDRPRSVNMTGGGFDSGWGGSIF